MGHESAIATIDWGSADLPVRKDVEVYTCGPSFPKRLAFSREMWRLARVIVEDFDLVIIHGLYLFPTWAFGEAARKSGVPYVIRPHGTLMRLDRRNARLVKAAFDGLWQARLVRRAHWIWVTSELEDRESRDSWLLRGTPAVRTIPLAVEIPQGVRARDAPSDPLRVGYIGRLASKKNVHLILHATQALAASGRRVDLRVAGSDHGELSSLLDLSKRLSLPASVFVGEVSGHAKEQLFDWMDVFVLPSDGENFGVAVAEAMAYAVPVVVSSEVNLAPLVVASRGGTVVAKTVEAVARGIEEVSDGSSYGRRSRAARKAALEHLSIGTLVNRVLSATSVEPGPGPETFNEG